MNKISLFLIVMSMIVSGFSAPSHASVDFALDAGIEILKSADDLSDSENSPEKQQNVECHKCCNANSHITLSGQQEIHNYNPIRQEYLMFIGDIYSSELKTPPFQPPRA